MKTRDQERMQQSWDTLSSRFPMNKPFKDWEPAKRQRAVKYLADVKKTAPRIHVSGIGQAVAFLQSRGDQVSKDVYSDISTLTLQPFGLQRDIVTEIRGGEMSLVFALTDEAIEICGWLARYLLGAGVEVEPVE